MQALQASPHLQAKPVMSLHACAPLHMRACAEPPCMQASCPHAKDLSHARSCIMACGHYWLPTILSDDACMQVRYRSLLTMILSHAHGCELPPRVASGLEVELLQALRWRLGPFFHSAPSCCACCAPAAQPSGTFHLAA